MGAPNIQQQMYLKKALNENMDGMFNHPEQLDEAKRKTKAQKEAERNEQIQKQGVASRRSAWLRAKRASHNYVRKPGDKKGTWVPKTEAELKKERDYADSMMKGYGGSLDESYTMRKQYGRRAKMTPQQRAEAKAKGDAHVAKMSKTHTWVKGSGKNGGKWVPKQETNESTYAKSLRASRRTGNFAKFLAAIDRRTANIMRRGGASPRTMRAHFNQGDFAAGSRAIEKFEADARRKQGAISPITEGLLNKIELAEGSRGTKRLERKLRSLAKNRKRGMEIIGKAPENWHIRSLVNPNDPEVKAYKERLAAGVAHMEKKRALRNQINADTRAAAMRERMRAGLHPGLNRRDVLSPSIPSAAHQGNPINVTGGYEHQENPKRVPKAVKKYREESRRKSMRGRKS